ncbi:MAG: Do family serine endopeptidase [Planctomyces sp.]|nr:Do family serine endopeptidase [Planctomyces sp.]
MKSLRNGSAWVLTVIGGMCLGAGALWSQPQVDLPQSVLQTPSDLSLAFREAAKHVLPSVVSITSKVNGGVQVAEERGQGQGGEQLDELFGNDEFLRRFFGNDGPRRFQGNGGNLRRYVPPQVGNGSGVIIGDGIVLTNAHVVSSADEVTVELHDGRRIRASSWATDPRRDIAIVKVEADNLSVARLGDSDAMQIGDWVLALGNPFNVGVSVTQGIVSATGRATRINELESYIQTDAAVNPGNSGGPLINLKGEVVGINTAISTNSGGYDGVSFAIPVNMVQGVIEQLIETGKVQRSYLGVALQSLTPELQQRFGAPQGGALVSMVKEGAPAAKAGVQAGDVIVELAGQPITNSSQLTTLVEGLPPGETQTLAVMRQGKKVDLKVVMEEMPEDYTDALRRTRPARGATPPAEVQDAMGLKVTALTPEIAAQLSISERTQGVVVTEVELGSVAYESGLRRGDVVQRVGDAAVTSPQEFKEAVDAADRTQGILLHVSRGDNALFLIVSPTE